MACRIHPMFYTSSKWRIIRFRNNLTVPRDQHTVHSGIRAYINQLGEGSGVHPLIFGGRRLPFFGRPDLGTALCLRHVAKYWGSDQKVPPTPATATPSLCDASRPHSVDNLAMARRGQYRRPSRYSAALRVSNSSAVFAALLRSTDGPRRGKLTGFLNNRTILWMWWATRR